jgi:hypothetical protein
MPQILGVIPLLGRDPVVHGSLGGTLLVDRALSLMSSMCDALVIVSGSSDGSAIEASTGAEHLRLPADDPVLRRRISAAAQVVVHDPLCPLVPAEFVRGMVAHAGSRVVVAVRPVVDTIKATDNGLVSGTVDRDRLRVVSSPVVVPADVLQQLPELGAALADLSVLVSALRATSDVELVMAPSAGRRIEDASGLRWMASVDAISHRQNEQD